ncbi:NADP-dependent isocitrate dehydrogenase, partial [bacterium]
MSEVRYEKPSFGTKITKNADGSLNIPSDPIIPFIEGDGTGPDIWRASKIVFDHAVELAYGGKRKISWLEILAGEKAFNKSGQWLPEATLEAIKEYRVAI